MTDTAGPKSVKDCSQKNEIGTLPSNVIPKPPNNRKFHAKMDKISALIDKLQKNLEDVQKIIKESNARLSEINNNKTKNSDERKVCNQRMEDLGNQIRIKNALLGKLQIPTHLQYKNEKDIDESVRVLETSLQTKRYSLAEEKRLVCEIDALKRSKKIVREYRNEKAEREKLKDHTNEVKKKRDELYHRNRVLSDQEKNLKQLISENKKKELEIEENIKSNLELQKNLKDNFISEKKASKNFQKQLMASKKFEKKKQNATKIEEKQRDRNQVTEPIFSSNKEEIQICKTLISYLNTYQINNQAAGLPMNELRVPNIQEFKKNQRSATDSDNMQELYGGMKSHQKKKGHQRKLSQLVKLSPEMLNQFMQLNISPPSSLSNIPVVLDQLHAKLLSYSPCYHSLIGQQKEKDQECESAIDSISSFIPSFPSTPDQNILSQPIYASPNDSGMDEAKTDTLDEVESDIKAFKRHERILKSIKEKKEATSSCSSESNGTVTPNNSPLLSLEVIKIDD